MNEPLRFVLPIRGKAKPRPKFARGRTYMPSDYVEWVKDVRRLTRRLVHKHGTMEGPLRLGLSFGSEDFEVVLTPFADPRAKYVRSDADNLAGGIMDAMQGWTDRDSGITIPNLIHNDRQITELSVNLAGRNRHDG